MGQHCTDIGWMFRICWDVVPVCRTTSVGRTEGRNEMSTLITAVLTVLIDLQLNLPNSTSTELPKLACKGVYSSSHGRVPTQNWKQNSMTFPWFSHDTRLIFQENVNSVLAVFVICPNCYYSSKLFLRQKIKIFEHMQPSVVKYQAKKETQVTKKKFCNFFSDIEKNADNKQDFMIFPWKCPFLKYHDFSMHIIFLGQIPCFPGELEPCMVTC